MLALFWLLTTSLEAASLPAATPQRTKQINFETEILPILKQSCLACHNQTKAKADLILETPATILKGGESGPAVAPGQPAESLLLDLATHRKKPFMPPADNKVNAPDLTPLQLALLKRWIEQGASGEVHGAQAIAWRALSGKVRPILSLAVTADGQFAACGRGNEIVVYQLPTQRTIGPLVDPELGKSSSTPSSAAHLDLAESLDFSPDGQLLASGSYREVKLWRLEPNLPQPVQAPAGAGSARNRALALATSNEAKLFATGGADGVIRLWTIDGQKLVRELKGDYQSASRLDRAARAFARSTNHLGYRKSVVENDEKERQTQLERVRKASELVAAAQNSLKDQTALLAAAKKEETEAGKELAGFQSRFKEAQAKANAAQAELQKSRAALKNTPAEALDPKVDEVVALAAKVALVTNELAGVKVQTESGEKATQEKIKAIQKRIADSDAALIRLKLTNSAVDNELHFAITGAQSSFDELTAAQNNLQLAESDRKQNELQLESAAHDATNSISHWRALAFAPDGQILAGATDENSVTLWSVGSGEPLQTIVLTFPVSSLSFASGDTIVCYGANRAETFSVFPRWKLERSITVSGGQPAFADRVNAVRFSPDGQFLATGGGEPSRSGEVKIWRVKDGQLAHEFKNLHSDAVFTLAYSPDGRYLASGAADRFAKISEVASGKVLRVLEGHTHHVLALGWKGDGHTVVTAGADNLVKIWDAFSAQKRKGPEALGKEVTGIGYLGETDQIFASCGDSTLRLLKESGETVRTFEGASGYLQTAVATSDGHLVLAGGHEGILRVWEAASGKLVAEYR